MKQLGIIVAVGPDRVIGKDGTLPWHLPEDLRHFKRTTSGHAIIMGRRTWESIGRPLPKRTNIVVSRRGVGVPEGVHLVGSLDEALEIAWRDDPCPFVIGGAGLYEEALDRATVIELTEVVHPVTGGDTFFPMFDRSAWREVRREPAETDGVTFVRLERAI